MTETIDKDLQVKILRFEEVKLQIKELEEEVKELKPIITEAMSIDEKINCKEGKIEMKKRDNWKFSEDIQQHEQELKEEKKEAIAKGEATNNPTYFIEYRKNK